MEIKKFRLGYNYQNVEQILNCYNKELFETHGWCEVAVGERQRKHDDWGFCDTSCEGAKVRIVRAILQLRFTECY